MDPLTILGLVKFVPELIGLFDKKKGKQAQEITQTVGKVAEAITGKTGDAAANAIHSDPKLAYEFQLAVMADSHVQEQLALANIKDARAMYRVNPGQADDVAKNIMRYNLVMVFILVIVNCLAVVHLKDDAAVLAIVSNFIGIVLHSLLRERQEVTGFYFGSSLGSKLRADKSD